MADEEVKPEDFATDNVPDGEEPPGVDDADALQFLKDNGWPT